MGRLQVYGGNTQSHVVIWGLAVGILHSQRDVVLGEKASVEHVRFLAVEGRAMLDSTGFVRKNGTPAVW